MVWGRLNRRKTMQKSGKMTLPDEEDCKKSNLGVILKLNLFKI